MAALPLGDVWFDLRSNKVLVSHMRDMPTPWIAKDQIFRRSADGTVTELTLEVGQPRELEGGDWACAITIGVSTTPLATSLA